MWRSNISRVFVYVGLTACLLSLSASPATSSRSESIGLEQQQPPPAQPPFYEAYFRLQGTYPDEEDTAYSPEFQGLTHDDNNWFIANNMGDKNYPGIWKIPVSQDLRHVMSTASEEWIYRRVLEMEEVGPGGQHVTLGSLGYHHIGDISYFKGEKSSNIGYVLAPIESSKLSHAIALFKGDNLEYVGRAEVDYPELVYPDGPPNYRSCNPAKTEGCRQYWSVDGQLVGYFLPMYRDLGWVAVDPDGYIYTSPDFTTYIYKYHLNWEELPNGKPKLTCIDLIRLRDRSDYPLELSHTQGGVFSEQGGLLYMLTGIGEKRYESDGINVFDTQTWRRVAQSTFRDDQPSDFHYKYEFGCCEYQEPEGITIWDLDGKGAPGISGQLHVGMLENDVASDDDVHIHHYGMLYSDGAYKGPEGGDRASPFNTVCEAYARAWNGAQIKIQPGFYPEALTLSKQVELRAPGGTVTIGPSIATTPLPPSSTASVQSPLAARLSDPASDFVTTNEKLLKLLAQSSAANDERYTAANIRAALAAGEGAVIFFEDSNYGDSYRAFWSGGGGTCDPLSYAPSFDSGLGGMTYHWEEADSFLFFAPEPSSLVLHIYDYPNYEGTNIRFRGPAAVSDMNDLNDGRHLGFGGDEMESFKFEDY